MRRAFTLIDTAVATAALGILASIALIGLSESRHSARNQFCMTRLGAIGAGNAAYALSFQDFNAALSWTPATANSQWPDLMAHAQSMYITAQSAQAIDFLRRRGRIDIPPISGWQSPPRGWSLVLTDFENRSLSDPFNICPSDDLRTKWRRNPDVFDAGGFLPRQPAATPQSKHEPYLGSYSLTTGGWDTLQSQEVHAANGLTVFNRVGSAGTHNTLLFGANHRTGPSPMSIVAFPSRKVLAFDSHQRHFGGSDLFHAYPNSRQPILHFDGSVRERISENANTTWIPASPTQPGPQKYLYIPRPWEGPLANGTYGQEEVSDPYRWTRHGLLGWDFAD